MPTLIVTHNDQRQEVLLDGKNFLIGRDPTNQLVISDTKVSRFHCRLTLRGDRYRIEDLESTSGTLLEGQPISDALLTHGQTISVGAARILFDAPPSGESSDSPVTEHGLYVIGGPKTGQAAIFSETIQVGRAPDCELILDGPLCSNYHCSIKVGPEGLVLQDLGSTNGTLLNDGKTTHALLISGDEISIGEHRLLVAPYPPAALPDAPFDPAGWIRPLVELGMFSAICLLLWSLLTGMVIRPLLGPAQAKAPAGSIPFRSLDSDQLYEFESSGSCEITVVHGAVQTLRVSGTEFAGKEFRAVVKRIYPIDQGWSLSGSAQAPLGAPRVSLFAEYLDSSGNTVVQVYSPLTELSTSRASLEARFGPQQGATSIRFGYSVVGELGEVLLTPLRLFSEKLPGEVAHSMPLPDGGELTLLPGGEIRLQADKRELLSAEFGRLEEGAFLGSTRNFQLGGQIGQSGGLYRRATQVGPPPDTRHAFSLSASRHENGVEIRYKDGDAIQLKWRWSVRPDSVSLYYRGTPVAQNRQRLLLDEMVIRWAHVERTCRFTPPVYRESRWQDATSEFWQLRFAEKRLGLLLQIYPGNRQRARTLDRVRGRYRKVRLSKDLPAALKLLDRWTGLAGSRPNPQLAKEQRLVAREARRLMESTLASDHRQIAAELARFRDTIYEDQLEAELARRLMSGAGDRKKAARALLDRARGLAIEGYLSLARAALTLVIQQYAGTPAYEKAVQLLARLQD